MLRNPFHLVELSPWPFTAASGALFLTVGLVSWFHGKGMTLMMIGILVILLTMVQWWRDIIREGTYQGYHTSWVSMNLRWGMILFIFSEVCFFFAFFWSFFHSSLVPTVELGCVWPPVGVMPLNPFKVPLLNTAVLLGSGVSVTWAHHGLMTGNREEALYGLLLTVSLGLYFTVLQWGEYQEASFSVADSIYGSTFFVMTGFHGLHVLIGSVFLVVCTVRCYLHHFSVSHHFGFEAAAWYWHFVDVVWIFLYLCIYWWGS
uniref:Cytochrome c oxidase subunit 3 n=1 Tax=Anodonta anatina TaxID=143294 RepID=U5KJC6_ANOAN|nr:cytochrome c oxidase subunit III [Anodonta anatina]AGS17952.1 cytochrome c oxidase subunit III [Anodonta anatina]AGS17966.1 cytochrome c oxidase subunit III [Anodonta anatina]AGS17980.1 cytochrome c oxidase subunit III [Anodonta anatina]AGS18008.1 cytochrome c oxidase subunit III [Anodonta anatina]